MNYLSVFIAILFCVSALIAQETGQVIITEIMYNPGSDESTTQTQYIEIANTTGNTINLQGWTIDDEDADGPNTLPNVDLPPYGIAVICGGTKADFENAWGSGYLIISLKDDGQTMFNMSNSPTETDEIIQLRDNNGVLVDEVNYDDASPWPADNNQSSIYLNIPKSQMNATTNNDGANWSLSQVGVDGARASSAAGVWSAGDVGSPGNILGDNSLPVSLRMFTATAGNGVVLLRWITESEVNNVGFEIWRSQSPEEGFQLISSYKNNPDLQGQYTTNSRTEYRFVDQLVQNGTTYYYKLVDVDVQGKRNEHGPISAIPRESAVLIIPNEGNLPQQFALHPNYPNPFNPSTTIAFDIAQPDFDQGEVPIVLEVFNTAGQKVFTIFEGTVAPGKYELPWFARGEDGRPLPAGIYFLQLRTPHYRHTIKMILLP